MAAFRRLIILFLVSLVPVAYAIAGGASEEAPETPNATESENAAGTADVEENGDAPRSADAAAPGNGGSGSRGTQAALSSLGIQVFDERVESVEFSLENLRGGTSSLSDYRGKVVLLNFWATWCGPCREEMPSMDTLYQAFKEDGLVVLAVSLQESRETVEEFVDQYGYSFPILLDPRGGSGAQYVVRGIPTSYLIGRDGAVLGAKVGFRYWDSEDVMDVFRTVLSES